MVLAGRLQGELIAATDDRQGLRGVLAAHADEIVDVPSDERCLLDLNTPAEYEAALATLTGGP